MAPGQKSAHDTLRKLPFLKGIKEAMLDVLANSLKVRFIQPGDVIVSEGEECTELIFLRRGSARGKSSDGTHSAFSDGSVIGNPQLFFAKTTWPSTVMAKEFCDVQTLCCKDFKAATSLYASEGAKIAKALTRPGGRATFASVAVEFLQKVENSEEGLLPSSSAARRASQWAPSRRSQASPAALGAPSALPRVSHAHKLASAATTATPAAMKIRATITAAAATTSLAKPRASKALPGSGLPDPQKPQADENDEEEEFGSFGCESDSEPDRELGAPRMSAAAAKLDRLEAAGQQESPERGRGTLLSPSDAESPQGRRTVGWAHLRSETARLSVRPQAEAGEGQERRSVSLPSAPQPPIAAQRRFATATPLSVLSRGKPRETQQEADLLQTASYIMQGSGETVGMEMASWLDKVPFCRKMDAFAFERLLDLCEKQTWRRNDVLVKEGAPATALHIIYAGEGTILKGKTEVARAGVETVLGERSLTRLCCRTEDAPTCGATVVVRTPVLVTITVQRVRLETLIETVPCLSRALGKMYELETTKKSKNKGITHMPGFAEAQNLGRGLESAEPARSVKQGTVLARQGDLLTAGFVVSDGELHVKSRLGTVEVSVTKGGEPKLVGARHALGLVSIARWTVTVAKEAVIQVLRHDSVVKVVKNHPCESGALRHLVEIMADVGEATIAENREKLYHTEAPHTRRRSFDNAARAAGGGRPVSFLTASRTCANLDVHAEVKRVRGDMSMTLSCEGDDKMAFMGNMAVVKELCFLPEPALKALGGMLHLRLYFADQAVLNRGDELENLFILQQGTCSQENALGESVELSGPCVIGTMVSLLNMRSVLTVVSSEMSYVATIPKGEVAAVLDRYPEQRKQLFSKANLVFLEYAERFSKRFETPALTASALRSLPLFAESAPAFLQRLVASLHLSLYLPGQVVQQNPEDIRFFMIFDGRCTVLSRERVVGQLSSGMVFGEMRVFSLQGVVHEPGADDDGVRAIKTLEMCQVGSVKAADFLAVLQDFPKETAKVEQIVHGHLEETVCATLSRLAFFAGLPQSLLTEVCTKLLERRLVFGGQRVVCEGEAGDAMFVVNAGKLRLFYQSCPVGMLWAGKAWGQAQLLGLEQTYHGTLVAVSTCQLLLLNQEGLGTLALGQQKRHWILTLRQRAKAAFESEVKLFAEAKRRQTTMISFFFLFSAKGPGQEKMQNMILSQFFTAWKMFAQSQSDRDVDRKMLPGVGLKTSRALLIKNIIDEMGTDVDHAVPMLFSRGLRHVSLTDEAVGLSADVWRSWSQAGRLDAWSGMAIPNWLAAVREEIPAQFVRMKQEARGEYLGVIAPAR